MPIDDAKDFGNPACLQAIQSYLRRHREKFSEEQLQNIETADIIAEN